MAELSGQHRQVWVVAVIGIVLSLGILVVATAVWGVAMARPLPILVERREVVATVAGRALLVVPPAAAGGGGLAARMNLGPVEAAAVRPGAEAVLTFDRVQRTVVRGRVTEISQTKAAPWPVYRVLIQIAGGEPMAPSMPGMTTSGGIGPGLSSDAVITVGRLARALAVPNNTLVRSARGEFSVSVLRQGEWRMVRVQVGLLGDEYTEIRDGLREGEIVQLTPGVPGAR